MIRVLKFVGVFHIGGTERQFVNIVKHLDRSKFDLHLACFRKSGDFLAEIEATGRPLTDYGIENFYSPRTVALQLKLAAESTGAEDRARSIREEFGIPRHAPLVGAVCRLSPVKGVDVLLDAALRVRASHPDARFLIAGGGECERELKLQCRRLGLDAHVVFTGFRVDAARVLASLDVAVVASTTEGLSNTLMEAMAVGIPVVATRVGGNVELVEHGVTGLLVEPLDVPVVPPGGMRA